MGPMNEVGLSIFFLSLLAGYAICMADWYWFRRWGVFEGSAIYFSILAVFTVVVAAILAILGY